MSREFRDSVDAVIAQDAEAVGEVVAAHHARVFELGVTGFNDSEDKSKFVGAAPPAELSKGSVATVDDLDNLLLETELRWRLEAVLALDDYLD